MTTSFSAIWSSNPIQQYIKGYPPCGSLLVWWLHRPETSSQQALLILCFRYSNLDLSIWVMTHSSRLFDIYPTSHQTKFNTKSFYCGGDGVDARIDTQAWLFQKMLNPFSILHLGVSQAASYADIAWGKAPWFFKTVYALVHKSQYYYVQKWYSSTSNICFIYIAINIVHLLNICNSFWTSPPFSLYIYAQTCIHYTQNLFIVCKMMSISLKSKWIKFDIF